MNKAHPLSTPMVGVRGINILENFLKYLIITYRDTLTNGYVLNYILLTTHSSHLYSMWNFTHTCN